MIGDDIMAKRVSGEKAFCFITLYHCLSHI